MTDKIQQARRELFEAWTKSEHGDLTRRQDGEYFDDLTHGAWLGFNAALDCVVIELPPERNGSHEMRGLCIDAIESTAADALMQVFGFERVTKMVWELTHGERFTVEGFDTVWRFRNMDGRYCYAESEQGQILNWSGPVTIVK